MDSLFKRFVARLWTSDCEGSDAKALHATVGDQHSVVFKSMRVIIVKDGDQFFAQSIDIDYAASGNTLEEVQSNFERGLSATIKAHLQNFGNIDKIMLTPDTGDWAGLLKCDHGAYDLTTISHHKIENRDILERFHFNEISYQGYMHA